ncbi:MAG: hypothetical protein H6Q37_494 [Chloroflexi bacterium]|nr:hypothetical protein [Chloroflexota bacterium]
MFFPNPKNPRALATHPWEPIRAISRNRRFYNLPPETNRLWWVWLWGQGRSYFGRPEQPGGLVNAG